MRQLERALGRLTRKVALRFAEGRAQAVTARPEELADMLGPERFFQEQVRQQLPPGVATGLAWTEAGGDVLYIEATLLPSGKVLVAGGTAFSGDLSSAEVYDPALNTWGAAGNLGTARESHTATLLPSGKVFVAGGFNAGSNLSSAELFDPASGGSWSLATSLATAHKIARIVYHLLN